MSDEKDIKPPCAKWVSVNERLPSEPEPGKVGKWIVINADFKGDWWAETCRPSWWNGDGPQITHWLDFKMPWPPILEGRS